MLSVPWQPPVTHPVVVSTVTTGCKTITSQAKMLFAFFFACACYMRGLKYLNLTYKTRVYPQTHRPLICFLIWVLISSLLLHWQVPPPSLAVTKRLEFWHVARLLKPFYLHLRCSCLQGWMQIELKLGMKEGGVGG